MLRYLLARLLQAIFVLWAAFTLAFFILYGMPGDPAVVMLTATGQDVGDLDPSVIEAVRQQYGFDRPLIVQYLDTLRHAVILDFGNSYAMRQPVTEMIARSVPITALLAVCTLVVAFAGAFVIAVLAAYTRSARLRQFLTGLPPLAISVPTFWVGLVLLQVFSFTLGWFPGAGTQDGLASLVLPVATLAIWSSASVTQVLTRSLLTSQREPHIETARSKGVSRWRAVWAHSLRGAAIPALTIAGITIGNILAGAAITETVFSWNGLGRLTVSAVASRDIPLMLGIVVFAAAVYVVISFVVDALYPLIDPRIARAATHRPKKKVAA